MRWCLWKVAHKLFCDSLSSSLAVVALIYNEDQVLSYVDVTLACDDVYGKWLTNCFVRLQLTFYLKYIISLDWKFTRPITSVVMTWCRFVFCHVITFYTSMGYTFMDTFLVLLNWFAILCKIFTFCARVTPTFMVVCLSLIFPVFHNQMYFISMCLLQIWYSNWHQPKLSNDP